MDADRKAEERFERVARMTQERFAGVGDESVAHRIGNARENAAKDGQEPNAGDDRAHERRL